MEHLVSLIDAIAWPATVLALALLLRREIKELLSRLSKFRYREIEATFDRELAQAEREIQQVPIPQPPPAPTLPPPQPPGLLEERLNQIAQVSPRAAILEAWVALESAIVQAARDAEIELSPRTPLMQLVRGLVTRERIPQSLVRPFEALRFLRNQAVHVPEFAPSYEEARRYIELATSLRTALGYP